MRFYVENLTIKDADGEFDIDLNDINTVCKALNKQEEDKMEFKRRFNTLKYRISKVIEGG